MAYKHCCWLGKTITYILPTLIALIGMFGSAFIQSLDEGASWHALLLLVESTAALVWEARNQSRSYVGLGGLVILADAMAQFGPAFVSFTRWVQLAIIGSILLGAGLAALFRREEILTTRRALWQEWNQWKA
jgi:hypothetical protein